MTLAVRCFDKTIGMHAIRVSPHFGSGLVSMATAYLAIRTGVRE